MPRGSKPGERRGGRQRGTPNKKTALKNAALAAAAAKSAGGRYRDSIPQFNSFSWRKSELDRKLPAKMPGWTLHDLRRTARSLMSRAGVSRDHSERVLGHAIAGVGGVYDRYAYFDEKADALQRLATLIETIISPPDATNVVPLAARR